MVKSDFKDISISKLTYFVKKYFIADTFSEPDVILSYAIIKVIIV